MGSDSDLPVMNEAAKTLESFDVGFDLHIASAHRTPGLVEDIVKQATDRGARVIIAGAGLSAHLPGVIASHTTLPVIGVPLKAGALNGVDALYSIVQMPPGIPVATVGIDAARNAALLAVQILAAGAWERGDDDAGDDRTPVSGTGSVELPAAGGLAARLARRLREYRDGLAASVEAKERRLQTKGYGGSEG
ncbi:MAG: 5-(carboxyamino)imidazole ribonucleotide mutase [Ignavibacteriales bacterium]